MSNFLFNDYKVEILKKDLTIEHLKNNISDQVFIDIETNGLNVFRDRICKIQLLINDNIFIFNLDKEDKYTSFQNLEKILHDYNIQKVFHHAKMDVAFLQNFGFKINNIFCTKIASKITRTYTDKHGLHNVCKDLIDKNLNKSSQQIDWGKNIQELNEENIFYLCEDVVTLKEIKEKLINIAEREDRLNLINETMSIIKVIVNLELNHYPIEKILFHSCDNKEILTIKR